MKIQEIYDDVTGAKYKYDHKLYLRAGEYVGYFRCVIYSEGLMVADYPQIEYEIEDKIIFLLFKKFYNEQLTNPNNRESK